MQTQVRLIHALVFKQSKKLFLSIDLIRLINLNQLHYSTGLRLDTFRTLYTTFLE